MLKPRKQLIRTHTSSSTFVESQEDYKKNEARIVELQSQEEDLARGSTHNLLDMDSVQASRLSELKR